jgi:hypothetical protein
MAVAAIVAAGNIGVGVWESLTPDQRKKAMNMAKAGAVGLAAAYVKRVAKGRKTKQKPRSRSSKPVRGGTKSVKKTRKGKR